MKCKRCGEIKLSKEFPPFRLAEECEHPPLHCLRCVTGHWETHQQCSQCDQPIPESALNLRKCYARLESLFPQITYIPDDDNDVSEYSVGSPGGSISVARLNGETFDLAYNGAMTIGELKNKVHEYMKVHPDKQSLLYNGQKLQEFNKNNRSRTTLRTSGVKANSTIHLMVLLYAVPTNLDKVVFDLYWGFPSSGKDYLDACAWAFNGQKWVGSVRFYDKVNFYGALRHSGDKIDWMKRQGHQYINVDLHRIPSYITHIYFTLSSYSSRTIARFVNPSMKFYAANRPDVMLCEDQTKKAGHRQAIIMCSLQRIDNKWQVHENGALSDGQAQIGIEPILITIQGLIAKTGSFPYYPLNVVRSTITDPTELALVNARK